MSKSSQFFNIAIRVVFVFAFGAFLSASIHHVAFFFQAFEPNGTDMKGSYALAIAVDGTALILTIGIMFFGQDMPASSKVFIWFFIVALTGFSWLVNWEYASHFQAAYLTKDDTLKFINPILASSFAFLNLAYSVVSERFNLKTKTAEELQKELSDLQSKSTLEKQIADLRKQNAGPGLIQHLKNVAIESKKAVSEVLETNGTEVPSETDSEQEEDLPNIPEAPTEGIEQPPLEKTTEPLLTSVKPPVRASQSRRKNVKRIRGNGLLLIQKELEKNPQANNATICRNTGLSPSYVSTARARLANAEEKEQIAS